MKSILYEVVVTTFYFVALINPISKVSILSVFSSHHEHDDFLHVAAKASLVAGAILLGAMVFGDFVLRSFFRVELYSLRLSGGAVLCWVGFTALRKGIFFEQDTHDRFEDVVLVPLACPMIAGPATIAACIATRAETMFFAPAVSLVLALGINHLVMVYSEPIGKVLMRFNLLGALVRLTGLIVMTIGMQMALDGLGSWQAL